MKAGKPCKTMENGYDEIIKLTYTRAAFMDQEDGAIGQGGYSPGRVG